MSKKDYIKIASAIKKVRDNKNNEREKLSAKSIRLNITGKVVDELIKVFKADNPLFSADKFEDAIYE